jgi:hypothetical protein
MAETPYLVDSNVLLRRVKPDHSEYPTIVSATDAILQRDGILLLHVPECGGVLERLHAPCRSQWLRTFS